MTSIGPDRDERLDRALAQWAGAARLPTTRGTEMLTSIMSTPAPAMPERRSPSGLPLARTWWKEHSADLAATFVSSTRAVPAAA